MDEEPRISPEKRISRAKIQGWINKGGVGDPTAVAVMGTSVERFLNFRASGLMPPYQGTDLLDYQEKIKASGGLLYYSLALVDGLTRANPQVAEQFRQKAVEDKYKPEWSLSRAKSYAERRAQNDYFFKLTGIYPETPELVEEMLGKFNGESYIDPDELSGLSSDQREMFIAHEHTYDDMIKKLMDKLGASKLESVVRAATLREGVAVLYGPKILDLPWQPGTEASAEFLITPKEPLDETDISSIQVGTIPEQEELLT